MPTTLSPTAQQMARTFHRWARRNDDGFFRVYSGYLQKRFGNQYAKAMQELRDVGALQIASPHHFDPANPGKGRSRGYIFRKIIDAPEPEITLPPGYQVLRARTNIARLSDQPFYVEGNNGDARVYTEFTALPKGRLNELTIDGEPVIQFDITNAFPLFIGRAIGAGEDYMQWARSGCLYDNMVALMAECGHEVTRHNVKIAINRIINCPGKLRFGRLMEVSEGILRTVRTADETDQRWIATVFRLAFPKEYKAFRRLANAGKGVAYRLGAREEAQIRGVIVEKAARAQITVIARHDAIICKASDVERLWNILRSIPAAFTLNCLSSPPISHLICTNPVSEQFFSFTSPDIPTKSPPE